MLGEEGVFGHLDGLTLVLSLLKTSPTLPATPPRIAGEEGMFGHLDGLTLALGALETSLTFPVVCVIDERVLRHV